MTLQPIPSEFLHTVYEENYIFFFISAVPFPFHSIHHQSKVVVYAPPERVDTLPLFLLYPYMSSVGKQRGG
jgi:hypothetical protein